MVTMTFPESFWWGTGASSTQTEGAAPNADWYRWERLGRAPLSGNGNGFSTEYASDFALLAEHGLTHHRLSLEWARLEPEPGRHDTDAVEHYTDVLRSARDAGIGIWACLHHFTLPGWFGDDQGGFLDDRARSYHWARHVDWVGETFGDLVVGWKPINEPVAYAFGAYLMGTFPPGRSSAQDFARGLRAVHLANHEAWRLLRSGGKPVATIMNLSPVFAAATSGDPGEVDATRAATDLVDQVIWRSWIRALRDGVLAIPGLADEEIPDMAGSFDLIGFSYYNAATVSADLSMGPYPASGAIGPLGYTPWSEGLALVLRRLAEELPGRPLLVSEYGLGTDDDDERARYLHDGIEIVGSAIDDGIDVRGFFHWTAVDNYEWLHGYDVSFGLFDRDRNPRGSASVARNYALAP
jgi:beta-glucosidase